MTEPLNDEWTSADPEPVDDTPVDVDLDLIDDILRKENVGQSTTVRIDGKVVHVMHAKDWSSTAMRAAANGDWDTWAREVIDDDDEFRIWVDSDLHNYQIEAVFNECGRQSRLNTGKSRRRSGSARNTRRH
jgi:hypothetical protein